MNGEHKLILISWPHFYHAKQRYHLELYSQLSSNVLVPHVNLHSQITHIKLTIHRQKNLPLAG